MTYYAPAAQFYNDETYSALSSDQRQGSSANGSNSESAASGPAAPENISHCRYVFADGAVMVVSEDGCLIDVEALSAEVLR
jgi:hypothetical protein